MIGSLQVYGAFAAVFAAMIWLSFVSQAVLMGAAWIHHRVGMADAARTAAVGKASEGLPRP